MYKRTEPPHAGEVPPQTRPPDDLRRRALELVLAEVRYQPALRARSFCSGFAVGVVLMAGIDWGYEQGIAGRWGATATGLMAHGGFF